MEGLWLNKKSFNNVLSRLIAVGGLFFTFSYKNIWVSLIKSLLAICNIMKTTSVKEINQLMNYIFLFWLICFFLDQKIGFFFSWDIRLKWLTNLLGKNIKDTLAIRQHCCSNKKALEIFDSSNSITYEMQAPPMSYPTNTTWISIGRELINQNLLILYGKKDVAVSRNRKFR